MSHSNSNSLPSSPKRGSPKIESSVERKYKSKLEKLGRNQGWNSVLDKELVRYQQKAWCYKRLHEMGADYYGTIDWIITLLIMICSIGSLFPEEEYWYIILSALTAGLAGFQKLGGYGKLEQQHCTAYNNYSKYVTQLRNMLKLYRRDRPYAKQYIEFISGYYDDLIMRGPSIDGIIIWQFNRQYRDPKIFLPDILSDNIDVLEKGIDGSDGDENSDRHESPSETTPLKINIIKTDTQGSSDDSDDSENSDSDLDTTKAMIDKRRKYELDRFHAQQTFTSLNFS